MFRSFAHLGFYHVAVALVLVLAALPVAADSESPQRLSEKYPGLSSGILSEATLEEMDSSVLVRARDKEFTRLMLADRLDDVEEDMRVSAGNYIFYVLEGMVTEPILLMLILGDRDAEQQTESGMQPLFRDYIRNIIDKVQMDEAEARDFYDTHPHMFPDIAYDDVKDNLMAHLRNEKQQQAWEEHVRNIGRQIPLAVNADWVAEQVPRVMDNPVDRARKDDNPVLAVFTADWCPACQQLAPVLERVREAHADKATFVVVDVEQAPFLAARYDIAGIPVLIFFDADGAEVERHTGFMEERALVAKLEALGTS